MHFKKLILVLFLISLLAAAQRLPGNVVPEHYSVTLTPDVQKATFTGHEVIDVKIVQPGRSITLNSAEIEFQETNITQNGSTQKAQVSLNPAKEQATLTVPNELSAGPATIEIQFTGILNDKLR